MAKKLLAMLALLAILGACERKPRPIPLGKQYQVRCWLPGKVEPIYEAIVSKIEYPGVIGHAWRFNKGAWNETLISETAICLIESA